jgi:hypothetical protein
MVTGVRKTLKYYVIICRNAFRKLNLHNVKRLQGTGNNDKAPNIMDKHLVIQSNEMAISFSVGKYGLSSRMRRFQRQ